tara:strand:+ start:1391 stop:3943 length:2553 start_codon:yes stop_codon:yes gene_type:complete
VIIKKKEITYKIIKKLRHLFFKLIFLLGIITFLFLTIITTYYFSSGMSKRFPPLTFIKNVDRVILDRYIGFSIFKIDDYFKIKVNNFKYFFVKNKLENVIVKIDQENLYNLELQRQQRLGKIPKSEIDLYNFSSGEIIHNKEKYPIKLRVKGDRIIHYQDKNSTSYKVDLRGPKRIWGLEEFALQKPITRNYVYEHMFHKLLEFNNLISLKYFFINLKLNDTDQGVYAVEEGFSKELIERNKRRNGPIFGIDEVISDTGGIIYPNVLFDLYSKKYWLDNYPELTEKALSKLNNFKKKNVKLDEVFDLEKWATYFAIIDISNGTHGAISKSVKLHYNTVTSKFEPIGFDAQINPEHNTDFLLLDFLNPNNNKCGAYCYDREWFLRFLKTNDGELNYDFVNLYLKKLEKLSSDEFLINFNKKYRKKINFFNSQIYSDNSKKTRGLYKGLGLYVFDQDFLSKRSIYIKSRLSKINEVEKLQFSLKDNKIFFDNLNKPFFKKLNIICENKKTKESYIYNDININFDKNCKYLIGYKNIKLYKNIFVLNDNTESKVKKLSDLDEIELIDNIYYLKKDIVINKDYYFSKNKKLIVEKGVKINFENDYLITSEGSILFQGSEQKPIFIDGINGKGSLILLNNKFDFDNVIIQNLSFPKDKRKILYGGINVINSKLEIKNTKIKNSNSEDAINIISSQSLIKNLTVKNIMADAIDIDFGILSFENILCENISNDCLDTSGAKVKGSFLTGNKIKDKGLSFGENSEGEISNINFQNTKLGIAVKDGSNLRLSKYELNNNKYDLAVFSKKKEYEESTLFIDDPKQKNNLKVLIGFKNNIIKDNVELTEKIDNNEINKLFY